MADMVGDILQPTHLLFILVVALLVLGPKRLPEVGRSLGKGIRDFKGAMAGIEEHTSLMSPTNLMAPSAAPDVDLAVATPMTPSVTVPEQPALPVEAERTVPHRPAVAQTAMLSAAGTTATFDAPAFDAPSLPPLDEVAQGIGLPADAVSAPRHEPEPSDYSD